VSLSYPQLGALQYKWQVKLVCVPLFWDNFWLSKPLKNWLDVEVWRSTLKGHKLVYQVLKRFFVL